MIKILMTLFVAQMALFAGPVADLNKAKNLYKKEKYQEAKSLFGAVAENRSTSAKLEREEALAYLAETQVRLGLFEKATDRVNEYRLYHPNGKYSELVGFIQARIDLWNGAVNRSAVKILSLMASTRDSVLYTQAKNQLEAVVQSGVLSVRDLMQLVDSQAFDAQVVYSFVSHLAHRLNTEGRYKAAAYYYKRLLADFPKHPDVSKNARALEQVLGQGKGKGVVLVVAPFNGIFADFGAEVLKGVVLAFEKYPSEGLSYQMVDSRGEPAFMVGRLQKLFEIENVQAVIGPIMSSNAAALAAWMSASHPEVPMITPTATDRGIAKMGVNVFQMNIPVYSLARDMGEYAALCEKVKKTLIIAPRTDYGRIMSEGYSEAFEKNGGEIENIAFYNEGEADYNKMFSSFRQQKLIEKKRKIALAKGGRDINKVMSYKEVNRFLQDSTIAYESVFIAASEPLDAALLAKQLTFHKIKARLFGSSGWYGKDVIRQGGRDIADAVFTAGFFDKAKAKNWLDFSQSFRKRWNEFPGIDKVSGLSYDAARFILKGFGNKNTALINALKEIKSVPGVYGKVEFNQFGENTNTEIVKIDNFRFTQQSSCITK